MQTLEELKAAQQQTADIERQVLEDIKAKAELLGYTLVKATIDITTVPANVTKLPVRAKYRDGNGNEWSGQGKRPKWLAEALDQGRQLEEFAV